MLNSRNTLIPLGHFAGAHGIKGQVLIKTYTQDPQDIASFGQLSDEDGNKRFDLNIIRITNKGVVASVGGVTDRNGAEALKGIKIFAYRDQLPEPNDDEWYYHDLIGLDVIDTTGKKIGQVIAMHDFGAGDLLELKLTGAKDTVMLTFNREVVPTIDLQAGQLTIVLPAGDEKDLNDAS